MCRTEGESFERLAVLKILDKFTRLDILGYHSLNSWILL